MVVGDPENNGIHKAEDYDAEHLRQVRRFWFDKGVRHEIVLGYDAHNDPCGILHPDAEIHGEGREWVVRR